MRPPSMMAIRDVVKGFQMPGTDIPGFQRKAVEMAVGHQSLRVSHETAVRSAFQALLEAGDIAVPNRL